ncbi:hypothetical protein SAMN04487779_101917 [Belnapia rosea]|uniref:Uncharacterized protein n=1 Tax=Belnapia rosea TaxID=938405 RepID=A0A1G7AC35_9PROT|nr:hypothetical protein SAMN04487779_101917 [Belnapia rosea]
MPSMRVLQRIVLLLLVVSAVVRLVLADRIIAPGW